ncbi:hypothetical protein QBC98_000814 [Kitasatospora acidiphila]
MRREHQSVTGLQLFVITDRANALERGLSHA